MCDMKSEKPKLNLRLLVGCFGRPTSFAHAPSPRSINPSHTWEQQLGIITQRITMHSSSERMIQIKEKKQTPKGRQFTFGSSAQIFFLAFSSFSRLQPRFSSRSGLFARC